MDMIERRIRDTVAAVLSRGAKALEQTAGELERAATELRSGDGGRDDPDGVWKEPSSAAGDGDASTTTRGAPLRVVPDTPTDDAPDRPHVPPVRPPQTPDRPRPGDIDADLMADAVMDLDPAGDVVDAGARDASADDPRHTDADDPDEITDADLSADIGSDTDPGGGDGRLRELADGTVSSIRAQLDDLSGDELRALRDIEAANRNRTTLLSAIDRALDDEAP